MSDFRPPLAVFSSVFATPATITPLGSGAVVGHVIWAASDETQRIRSAFLLGVGEIVDIRPRLSIRKDIVSALPIGSEILAAEIAGGTVRAWRVDEVIDTDPEFLKVVVH